MATTLDIRGNVAGGFEPVADAFGRNLESGAEIGASCAVYVDGVEVVNIWAGWADEPTQRPWDAHTIAMVFSATKGMTAICAHLLAQRGDLDYDRPVADYWPEFAANGKASITVRMLLNHQAGLPLFDEVLTQRQVHEWFPPVAALAAQRPVWEPGTRHGYHAITYGWLVGEVVRRVSGRSIGRFFAEEIATPLGLSSWIGLPDSEHARLATLVPHDPTGPRPAGDPALAEYGAALMRAFMDPQSVTARSFLLNGALVPSAEPLSAEDEAAYRRAELPSVTGMSDAASLARLYASCVSEVDGIRLLEDATLDVATAEQSAGPDEVLFFPMRWALGFMLPTPMTAMYGPSSFGHPGSGGSIGFADRDARIGFGYVMNKLGGGIMHDPRKQAMVDALHDVLGTERT